MSKRGNFLSLLKKGVRYDIKDGVPVFSNLTKYQEIEAKAWEDEWKNGIKKTSLDAYKTNMRIFKKLGYWEESGEAAGFIPTNKSMTVLDLGCGSGLSTALIRGKTVVGADLSLTQMIRAKKRWPDRNFAVLDAERLPFNSQSFNFVVAINLLHHILHPDKVLKEVYRVLKKNGTFLSVDPNLTNPIGFVGRGLFRFLGLSNIFPSYPQFALGEDERQFTKGEYYDLFKKSPFKRYRIVPHRIERLLFFATILFPPLIKIPFYEQTLILVSRVGDFLVKIPPFDYLCYFWIGKAKK